MLFGRKSRVEGNKMAGMTGFTIEAVDIRTAIEARDALQTLTGADRLSADYIKDGSTNHMMSVFQDSLIDANTLAYYKLTRNSTTQIQAEKIDNERDFVVVNGEIVSLSTAITCDLTDNLIAADGTDAGSAPLDATAYHVYLSNSSASFAPSDVRLSSIAPASGEYLAASGNGANWRRIGYLKTDSATATLTNDWQICGKGIDVFSQCPVANITQNAGDSDFYSNSNLQLPNFCVMPNTAILVFGIIRETNDNITTIGPGLYISGTEYSQSADTADQANQNYSTSIIAGEKFDISSNFMVEMKYYYTSGTTLTILSGPQTKIYVIRITT